MDIKKLIEEKQKIEQKLEAYYLDKIETLKKEDIEKYNPYQATELPSKKDLEPFMDQVWDQVGAKVGSQVWDQVRSQVWDQVWDQVWAKVRDQVWDQVEAKVGSQVWDQVWDQVEAKVGSQVWDQVWDQVEGQVWATSYWGVKIALDIPIKHWFFDFLRLGVMIVFVKGKVKVFGKEGKYLGEYDESEF